jgi:hypothetical protein
MTNLDCSTLACRPVVIDSPPVCVSSCTGAADCPGSPYFCEAVASGSDAGECIPNSPSHCLECAQDSDCGSLAERCVQAPGDIAKACHVDCTLSAAACPSDYQCQGGLCAPLVGICEDALGGYCDRLNIPQPCQRSNDAGTCIGERDCLATSKRFDKCSALTPVYKTSCAQPDPAGCSLQFLPSLNCQ